MALEPMPAQEVTSREKWGLKGTGSVDFTSSPESPPFGAYLTHDSTLILHKVYKHDHNYTGSYTRCKFSFISLVICPGGKWQEIVLVTILLSIRSDMS